MPRIKTATAAEAAKHPREFSILVNLAKDGEAPREVLLKASQSYGDETLVAALGDEVEFADFAKAFNKASQLADTAGEEGANCLGWAARDTSAQLSPYKFKRRELGPKDLFLKITHAGMCHSDLHTINGDWGPALHEIVGIVAAVGSEVTKFKVGDRAGVGTYVDSCRNCRECQAGDDQFCTECVFTYNAKHKDGLQSQGGYSSHIISGEHYTFKVPDNLDLAGVAPLLCAGITVYSPYKLYGLDKPGLKIGVVGLGGLGHMAVKFGVAFGCEVYVISRSLAKEAEALAMGAKAVIPTNDEEAIKANANQLDGIIDTVAAKHDFLPLFNMLKPKGKMCVVGAPPGDASFPWFPVLFKSLTLCSSLVGTPDDTQEMLDFCGEKNIVSDVEVIDISYANEAYTRMEKGDVKFRFVIDINKSLVA
ncbi:alcohol dehydrogenase, putative [Monoraphidium neglectum]|uniref:Alcohol dehydrogenase, putative n=1 Tax=Monoraphidium neglectum TaxID=145388 RepID=A0A0D2JJP3_9CHLO|nr:alcohol dehydrogenase, putative [Monoraphidium neglectum]KIY99517.1 alcohol dehydrogenase, putative [Monoraphidium neglectum]|eukprot:XP_013898537.1 alcohol dehydrogenase, putative [Monoraphidium neglectum]